ncbi:Uncharacterised protein [Mycobacteroides abscessus subsp. abscessus]|nr:Uncharacterised protein [Mycobacteroides abscessus subsp. abscessus]
MAEVDSWRPAHTNRALSTPVLATTAHHPCVEYGPQARPTP